MRAKGEVSASPEPLRSGSCCFPARRILTCCQRRREAATASAASPGKITICPSVSLAVHVDPPLMAVT